MTAYHRQSASQWPYVARSGYPNIVASTPRGYPTLRQTNAYKVYGHPPQPHVVNHVMHLVVTVFTLGLWLPVWFIITVATHVRNSRVDAEYWARIQRYYQWELSRRATQGG